MRGSNSEIQAKVDEFTRLARNQGRKTMKSSLMAVAKIMRRAIREHACIHGGSGEPLGYADIAALDVIGVGRNFDNTGGGCHYYADRQILARWSRLEAKGEEIDNDTFYTPAEKRRIARVADSILGNARKASLRKQIAFIVLPMEIDDAEELILKDLGIDEV